MVKQKKADKAMKARIEKLIDIYCTFMFGVDSDAGWHTPSQMDVTQYKSNSASDLMRKTKYAARYCASDLHQGSDSSNDKMINEMRFVRNKHYDFELAKMLFAKLEDKQWLALLAEHHLTYVYKKDHTEAEIANYLKIKKDVYRYNKKKALEKIESQLHLKDEFDNLMAA